MACKIITRIAGLVLLVAMVAPVWAQPVLSPLKYNAQLLESEDDRLKKEIIVLEPFYYNIDTLQLPFVDDFSSDKTKRYKARVDDPGIVETVFVGFLADGSYVDSLPVRNAPTFNYTKFQNGDIDTTENPPITVIFYDEFEPVDTQIVWTNVSSFVVDGQIGPPSLDILAPDVTFFNTRDTIFLVPDDDSHWLIRNDKSGAGAPFINNTFGFNPPTLGVASFDGVDALGRPYVDGGALVIGPADTLLSKPIGLGPTMMNVYLSFFYQTQGYGDVTMPGFEDSLVLEFYAPNEDEWKSVWRAEGPNISTPFQLEFVPIEDVQFLQPGFQFRFRNYAILNGVYENWNIDYVRLDQNVDTLALLNIEDYAFQLQSESPFVDYTRVPWKHFRGNPTPMLKTEFEISLNNLSDQQLVTTNFFEVYDDEGNLVFTSVDALETNVPSLAPFARNMPIDAPLAIFPENPKERTTFRMVNRLETTTINDQLSANDSLSEDIPFKTFYAYDDGTAEQGFALEGAGGKVAYEFNVATPDSLKAIMFYFPEVQEDYSDLPFRITVWSSLEPEVVQFENALISTAVYSDLGGFIRYELEEPVLVQGTYYIGWEQVRSEKIFVGFDLNINNKDKIWYQTAAEWKNESFEGSLMMRADFGDAEPYPVGVSEPEPIVEKLEAVVYPNPARQQFKIKLKNNDYFSAQVQIMDVYGRLIHQEQNYTGASISSSSWTPGIYLVQISDDDSGLVATQRLIISR